MSRPEHGLELKITMSGEFGAPVAVMEVIGEFDRLQTIRFDEAASGFPDALTHLTVDLTQTTIIDSGALGSLVRLRNSLDQTETGLSVIVSRSFQSRVMGVAGLIDFLDVREA